MGNTGNERFDVDALLTELTIEEKAALCSGSGFWHTRAVERLDIPQIMVSDGPHGLRQQVTGDGDHLGLDASVPATCFPPAVTVASSWNPEVARRIGDAIGVEARAAGLGVVLGHRWSLCRWDGRPSACRSSSASVSLAGSLRRLR